jgi:hypothetical protein
VRIAAALVAALLAPSAVAQSLDLLDRRIDAIDDPLRIEFGEGAPSPRQLRASVESVAKLNDWIVFPEEEGRWRLDREVRGEHRLRVGLTCDPEGCEIEYRESENLRYSEERTQSGAPVRSIHRNYNVWVRKLAADLAAYLGARARVTVGFARLGDVDAVPFIRARGREAYREFLKHSKPRAFAIAETGAYGASFSQRNPTYRQQRRMDVVARALERCRKRGGECRLYAVDDRVIWDPAR